MHVLFQCFFFVTVFQIMECTILCSLLNFVSDILIMNVNNFKILKLFNCKLYFVIKRINHNVSYKHVQRCQQCTLQPDHVVRHIRFQSEHLGYFRILFSKARQWPSCYDLYGSLFTLRRHSAQTKLKMVTFQKKEKKLVWFFCFNMYEG